MPITIPILKEQKDKYPAFHKQVVDAVNKLVAADSPNSQFAEGEKQKIGEAFAEILGFPKDYDEMLKGQLMNILPMPAHIAANYRTPEVIQALRKVMAQEQKARGAMSQVHPQSKVYSGLRYDTLTDDPADLILRGSWFHGMSPAARENFLSEPLGETMGQKWFQNWNPTRNQMHEESMIKASQLGLPGSTHALPSYTRFGEPYGISLTASPSIARKFAADENIHRVMPLYGGPPTERTLQLWKPEHQKRFNEAYNEAYNKMLPESQVMKYPDWTGTPGPQPYEVPIANYVAERLNKNFSIGKPVRSVDEILRDIMPNTNAKDFNVEFSNTLQNQGVRGLLYNPRRFGEYEMLMLDPKYAIPLDYRPVDDYITDTFYNRFIKNKPIQENVPAFGTPGAMKGYEAASPEFAANHARLSDMFNLMPWTERISQDNWKRILEQVDSQYREAVINQLFRK